MNTKRVSIWGSLGIVTGVAANACVASPEPLPEETGMATAAVMLAPTNALCMQIVVTNGTQSVTRTFDVSPESTTSFSLSGLPLGADTFTATAYSAACVDGGVPSTPPTWKSNPVAVTVAAGVSAPVTLYMMPANDAGGIASTGVHFPMCNPVITTFATGISATDIAAGADGNMWVTAQAMPITQTPILARITMTGTVTQFPVPTAAAFPQAITAGPDGNMWFVDATPTASDVGKATTAGAMTVMNLGAGTSNYLSIAAGPDGNMWVAAPTFIAQVSTTGFMWQFPLPTGADAVGIAAGPDGNMWFLDSGTKIGRITAAGAVTEFPIPGATASTRGGIALGPDGNMWFVNGVSVGTITPAGAVTLFTVPTAHSAPEYIVAGPDGALWFTEANALKVAQITTSGVVTEYPLTAAGLNLAEPYGIAVGPDGNLWIAMAGGAAPGGVVRMTPYVVCQDAGF
jgi:virginiamycin B lyase